MKKACMRLKSQPSEFKFNAFTEYMNILKHIKFQLNKIYRSKRKEKQRYAKQSRSLALDPKKRAPDQTSKPPQYKEIFKITICQSDRSKETTDH